MDEHSKLSIAFIKKCKKCLKKVTCSKKSAQNWRKTAKKFPIDFHSIFRQRKFEFEWNSENRPIFKIMSQIFIKKMKQLEFKKLLKLLCLKLQKKFWNYLFLAFALILTSTSSILHLNFTFILTKTFIIR